MNIKELIKKTYNLTLEINALTRDYNKNKEHIQKFFDEKNIKEIEVEPSIKQSAQFRVIVAQKQERITLDYNVDKLKENLSKEIQNEVIKKDYNINNIEGLIKLLKKSGVSPKEFKQYLDITETPIKAMIKELYNVGDIKKDDLKGCYSAKLTKSIHIKERK